MGSCDSMVTRNTQPLHLQRLPAFANCERAQSSHYDQDGFLVYCYQERTCFVTHWCWRATIGGRFLLTEINSKMRTLFPKVARVPHLSWTHLNASYYILLTSKSALLSGFLSAFCRTRTARPLNVCIIGSPWCFKYLFIASNTSATEYSVPLISLALCRMLKTGCMEASSFRMYCHCPGELSDKNAARRFSQISELLAPAQGKAPMSLNFVLFSEALIKQKRASVKSSFKSSSR